MQVKHEAQYQASPARVCEVLLSEELAQKRAAALGVTDYFFERKESGPLIQTVTRVSMPASALPEQSRRMLSNGLEVTVESSSRSGAAAETIDLAVQVKGAPVSAAATITLAESSGAIANTDALINVSFQVRVPFLGAAIEKKAAEQIPSILANDAALVNSLL